MARHYPLRQGNTFLVHGGSMIALLWRILEPVIPERTRAKVSDEGSTRVGSLNIC